MLKPKIDRDAVRYEESIWQRKHAVYSRECRKHGREPIPFDEWLPMQQVAAQHFESADNGR